jgi:hypothetical protein
MPRRRRKAYKVPHQVEQFRLFKIPGSNSPVAKLGIPVDAKIEDRTAQHEEIRLPVNPLVELTEF